MEYVSLYVFSFTQSLCGQVLEETNVYTRSLCQLGRRHGIKTQLHNGRKRREKKFGSQKTTALIATRVDIKRLNVGSLIQSFVQRRTKVLRMYSQRKRQYQWSKRNNMKEINHSLGFSRTGCHTFIVFCFH